MFSNLVGYYENGSFSNVSTTLEYFMDGDSYADMTYQTFNLEDPVANSSVAATV